MSGSRLTRLSLWWLLLRLSIAVTLLVGFSKQTDEIEREPIGLGAIAAENDSLVTLREYADDLSSIRLKLLQLSYINRMRAKYDLPPLKYDLLAGRVIASHLAEQTRERTFAHINLAGEYAWHRWAKTGRTDHVKENLFALFSTGRYPRELRDQLLRMHTGVDAFLAEKPPNDGHRKAILDPYATHVGLAFQQAPDDHSFRYGELYVNRYIELEPLPRYLKSSHDTLIIKGKILRPVYGPYSFFGYWTPPLQRPARADLFSDRPYPDGSKEIVVESWPWDFTGYRHGDNRFTLYLPINKAKPGLLYGVLHIRDKIETIPYRGGKATTEGTIPAAGFVIPIVAD